MSVITLALLVATAGLLLVAFTLISQSLEQRRAERRRLAGMLQRRIVQLQDLLQIPEGYLSPDLELFIYQSLLESCQQLARLDKQATLKYITQTYQYKVRELQKNPLQKPKPNIDTPAQLNEIKGYLKDIQILITNCADNGSLPRNRALHFKQYLTELILQINLDTYKLAAQSAIETGKFPAALHYCQQAKKALSINPAVTTAHINELAQYEKLIQQLNEKISAQAESMINQQAEASEAPADAEVSQNTHTSTINTDDATWKKKQIYD